MTKVTEWLRGWWVTLRYGSRFTRRGRELRRTMAAPMDEFVEVLRPTSVAHLNRTRVFVLTESPADPERPTLDEINRGIEL